MGNFSWDCKVCGTSLHRAWDGPSDPDAWQEDALLFAANGKRAEGPYDGYGKVGDFQIPDAWMHDDIAFWTWAIAQEAARERSARETDETLARCDALLAKHDVTMPPREPRPTPAPDSVDAHAMLEKAKVENIRFTVYHRRCWEAAGRPGFAGQSKPSEDQGR